jgi:putative FmdB family regulatory protein
LSELKKAPSFNIQRISKHQLPIRARLFFGIWSFEFLWCLELGCWSFFFPARLELPEKLNYFSIMPIYEFHCEKCGQDSEILVRSSDCAGTKCPSCGSTKIEKKFSTFASATAGQTTPALGKSNGGGRCCGGGCHAH